MSESSAVPDEPQSGEPDEQAEETPEEFTNRAARRAKGKATGRTEVFSKGQRPVGRGSAVQSPRQYGNRRSG
jgi:hypothetical protein